MTAPQTAFVVGMGPRRHVVVDPHPPDDSLLKATLADQLGPLHRPGDDLLPPGRVRGEGPR